RFAVLAILLSLACDSDKTSVAPPIPAPSPVLVSVVFQGPPPTVGPGQTAQMKAVARFLDGSERDVTADARWAATQRHTATAHGCVTVGLAFARPSTRATFIFRDASLAIVVKPGGTFTLTGNITEPGPVTVGGATVAVQGGMTYQVTANSFGFYELFGV